MIQESHKTDNENWTHIENMEVYLCYCLAQIKKIKVLERTYQSGERETQTQSIQ